MKTSHGMAVFLGFAGSLACGGIVEIDDAGHSKFSNEGPPLAIDAHAPHFVCHFGTPAVGYIDCVTIGDGGASYVDNDGVDCREYEKASGQGCIPPMECEATFDGVVMEGTCVDAP
jgi:hypothetical protein